MPAPRVWIPLAAIWVGFGAIPLAAQTLELRLREEATGAPIAGAIVRLLGDRGPVAQGLSNELGRVVLRAAAAGSYRLKVDRIGWSGLVTPPFPLAAGETVRRDLPMATTRTDLPALVVEGKSKCGSESQGGTPAALLWDEIRKALTANLITQQEQRVPLHLRQFTREVSRGGRPLREWVTTSTLVRGQPFSTLPPQQLAQSGFVYALHDTVAYAAPDAALLLSEEFVATHCFRAVTARDGRVGLGFEPVGGRKVVEVQGTLWVDRASAELRGLEYEYTGFSDDRVRAELGGKLDFQRLPAGEWIVSYWHVRMPRLLPPEAPSGDAAVAGVTTNRVHRVEGGKLEDPLARLAGYLDHGGRAEVAGDTLGRVDRALVVGQVYDSIADSGLADAIIRVEGRPDSVLTDAEGRFVLAVDASGDQAVTVTHWKLGLLREPSRRLALLSLGDSTRVSFATASLASFVKFYCGKPPRGRSGVVGILQNADGSALSNTDLAIQWRTTTGALHEERARSAANGLYAFCNLPPDQTLTVTTRFPDRAKNWQWPVRVEWGAFGWFALKLPGGGL